MRVSDELQPVRLRGVRDTCAAYAFIRNEIFRLYDTGADAAASATLEGWTGRWKEHATGGHLTRRGIEKTRRESVTPHKGAEPSIETSRSG